MKQITLIITILLIIGCTTQSPNQKTIPASDTISIDTTSQITTIQEIVDWANSQEYTEQEAAHWDSLSALYAYPVRDAERELDTIVNHLRIHFYKYE